MTVLTVARREDRSRSVGMRTRVAVLVAVVLCVIGAYAISHPLHDFIEYWTASHLLLAGKNPYSLPAAFQAQLQLGWREPVPLMFVSPPWALPLLVPLGLAKSYALAWLAWATALTAALALASKILMDIYFRDLRILEVSDTSFHRCLFAFTFYPVLLCLQFTQLTPWLLLGVAGFLYFENRRPILAGAVFSLTLIKPQLLYLVWVGLFLKSWQERRWKSLASAAVVSALLTTAALLFDHHAIAHYWELVRGPYLEISPSGATAVIRRALQSRQTFWMQFLPPTLGVLWFATYWPRYREDWKWIERMPTLVNASILTTAYGWIYDQTLLALPIIVLAAAHAREKGRISGNMVLLYTGLNCLLMLLMLVPGWAFWPAPIVILVLLVREVRGFSPSSEITVHV